jgi:hypothetical protein
MARQGRPGGRHWLVGGRMTAAAYSPDIGDVQVEHHQVAVDLAVELAVERGHLVGYSEGWRDGHHSAADFNRRLGIREWCRQRQATRGEYVDDAVLRRQLATTQIFGGPRGTTNAEHDASFVLLRAVAAAWKERRPTEALR